MVDDDDREVMRTLVPPKTVMMRPVPVREFIISENIFGTPTMTLIHRDRLLEAGCFDLFLDPASDWDCWINLQTRYSSAVISRHLAILRDDPHESIGARSRRVAKYYQPVLKGIDKWHKLDSEMRDVPLGKTPYGVHLCLNSFRYWNSAFYHLTRGQTAVLFALISGLARRGFLFKSLGIFIRKSLQGGDVRSLEGKPWLEEISHLFVSDEN
ncbi:hypothetical protein ACFLQ0_01905 [Nitrospinota bacterium]